MEEKIYTIPVTEAFEKKDGCPFCRLRRDLENTERDLIMGASMMEPDIRIKPTHAASAAGTIRKCSI